MALFTPVPIYSIPWQDGEKKSSIRVVASAGALFPVKDIWLQPHRKDYYLFQYITAGGGRHWVDMMSYSYKPGCFYFSSPEQVHVKEEDAEIAGTVITFTKEYLATVLDENLLRLPLVKNPARAHELIVPACAKPELEHILACCVEEYNRRGDLHTEMLSSYIRLLLTFLSRIYNSLYSSHNASKTGDIYVRFQSCLEQHYRTTHDANDYSRNLNLSLTHLNALLKQQTGKTVTTHLHERLILEAKRMMFTTDNTIKQIAFALGFHDTSYFSRFFKKITALSPSQYRQRISR